MHLESSFDKTRLASACFILAFLLPGCGKTATESTRPASPAKPVAQAGSTDPGTSAVDMDVTTAVLGILNMAHRSGGVILGGACGRGIADAYPMKAPVTLEPMDKALQEVSAKYQNIYWRESPASGVRIADSNVKARLLRVKVREFRIVEDREPDGAMADLWRAPEVAAFLRSNHVRFARRVGTARKVISPPMIVEMKKTTVADILDRIAAGYRHDPPKVWIYQECAEKKDMLVDVQMK
jgi:hypothetical protein